MPLDIIPRSFWNLPSRIPSIFDEEDNWMSFLPSSGLSISEDASHVFIEASVPGIDPDKVEITFDKGILWIKGAAEETEENKNRKYYRKASSSFSYRIAVPGDINESAEPEAIYKNGVMKVVFNKRPQVEPRKISVKKE